MSGNPQYQCLECGSSLAKWAGKCPDCDAWNSIHEVQPRPGWTGRAPRVKAPEVLRLDRVQAQGAPRCALGLAEFDRVLGGGLVRGSVVLIGGAPGIGKSTLLMQALAGFQGAAGEAGLYVSAEESAEQITLRAERLHLPLETLRLLGESRMEGILAALEQERPAVVVIDSIQTVYTEQLGSAPGAVAQVRECAACLTRYAKQRGASIFLVGHVTKEGTLAGPRMLEHMVDTVLYFEGEADSRFRMVRTVKNRFGAVNELGFFAMSDQGLREVSNPSAIFLARGRKAVPGSVVMVAREGTRPFLVEVQALVDRCQHNTMRRVVLGGDANRLAMLLAVLHRHADVATADQEIYVNVVAGVRITETAIDLAMLFAILSSLRAAPLPRELVVFGEVGLSGEVRPVQNGPERLHEAIRHGFTQAVLPAANSPGQAPEGMSLHPVRTLDEAMQAFDSLFLDPGPGPGAAAGLSRAGRSTATGPGSGRA